MRLFLSARDAVRERIAEATGRNGTGDRAPWTSSTAAACLLLLSGAAVALSPVAIGELVTASRDKAQRAVAATSPAPVPRPSASPPAPPLAASDPSDVPDLVVPPDPAAPPDTGGATVDDAPVDRPADLRTHRTAARPDHPRRPDEEPGEAEVADDREDVGSREDARPQDPAESPEVAQSESEQVRRDREKVAREREEIEAERGRIENSR